MNESIFGRFEALKFFAEAIGGRNQADIATRVGQTANGKLRWLKMKRVSHA
jgi:hypothetical protein